MRRRAGWVPLAAALALSAGCASMGGGEPHGPSESDEIKSRVLELQRKVTVAEIELERLRRQVAELEARLGSGAPPPERAEAPARIEPPMRVEPQEVEESDLELAPPPTALDEVSRPRATPPATIEPAGEPATAPGGPQQLSEIAQALYDRGYTLYHQGRYVDAETSFQRFLQSYPETELADNAQYWIGEARLARGDTGGALAAFREVVSRYPRGNKVPDALLKSGDALAALGDVEGARASYSEVIERFPTTSAAVVAEERRAALP